MEKQKVLSKLMWDLQSFLSVLDSENLSYIAQAQKKSISELVSSLQPQDAPAEDTEYVIMSCPSSSAPSNQALRDSKVWARDAVPASRQCPPGGSQAPGGDDDEDEDTYEEAQPFQADSNSHIERPESENSYYESYGEEAEDDDDDDDEEHMKDRAHYIQWSSSQPCLRPPPESRLCGYLWRRKWLGQWTKQLFIIRNHLLLCYKCARDLLPHLQLSLRGCQLVYKLKRNRKIPHQLKLLLLGADTLVLGYSSFQQADEWRQVIEELSVDGEDQSTSSELSLWSRRSSALLTPPHQPEPSHQRHRNKAVVSVLMNCQWQSLLCQVEVGNLNMFAEDGEEDESRRSRRVRSPQYTLQLRGCDVTAAPDGERPHRITLSALGEQLAVLEVRSLDEKRRWTRLLTAAADAGGETRQDTRVSGHALNAYMDQPFHSKSAATPPQPVYSNTPMLEHMLQSSQDAAVTYTNATFNGRNRKWSEVAPRGVQKLELTGRKSVPVRAGSEANLVSATNKNKRSSFRQSLAVCGERAQASLLNPLLRRTASVKTSLRRAPSTLFIEHGKVFQRRKEWETKAAA